MSDDADQMKEADMTRLKVACAGLMEHFDSVQIFVTRHEAGQEGGTVNASWGAGNWFARHGQVRLWLLQREQPAHEASEE